MVRKEKVNEYLDEMREYHLLTIEGSDLLAEASSHLDALWKDLTEEEQAEVEDAATNGEW